MISPPRTVFQYGNRTAGGDITHPGLTWKGMVSEKMIWKGQYPGDTSFALPGAMSTWQGFKPVQRLSLTSNSRQNVEMQQAIIDSYTL